jgi:hypothetical protein
MYKKMLKLCLTSWRVFLSLLGGTGNRARLPAIQDDAQGYRKLPALAGE